MKLLISLLFILTICIISCNNKTENSNDDSKLDDIHTSYAWLEGTWMRTTSRGISYESWQIDDTGFTGNSYRIKDNDTIVTERLWLVLKDSAIFYIAHPQQNDLPTEFKMIEHDSARTTFENPEHDFPTKISYFYKAPDSLIATIEGPVDDNVHKIDFKFEKIKQQE